MKAFIIFIKYHLYYMFYNTGFVLQTCVEHNKS
jgi:hypothetical protein